MTWQPKSSLTVETSHWTSSNMDSVPLHSSSRLWDLVSKWNAKFTFIWKEDFGPLSNSTVLFLHSPGKMLLTLSLVQKWLGSPFPEDVWAWWLLMHWLQLQSTPCEALPSVWIGFTWPYSQACGHSCCLCSFSYPNSSFQSTLHLICFDTGTITERLKITLQNILTIPGWWNNLPTPIRMLDPCQSSSNNWKLISFGTTWLHPKKTMTEQWLEQWLGVTSTSSVWLPLQDESLYVFPNCKSLWIKASAKWLNVNVKCKYSNL